MQLSYYLFLTADFSVCVSEFTGVWVPTSAVWTVEMLMSLVATGNALPERDFEPLEENKTSQLMDNIDLQGQNKKNALCCVWAGSAIVIAPKQYIPWVFWTWVTSVSSSYLLFETNDTCCCLYWTWCSVEESAEGVALGGREWVGEAASEGLPCTVPWLAVFDPLKQDANWEVIISTHNYRGYNTCTDTRGWV